MAKNKNISFISIEEWYNIMGLKWHSSDFFISPEEVYNPDLGKNPYRPNFYILGICVKGCVEFYVNGNLVTIKPNCLFAAGPHNILQRGEQSFDCITNHVYFTKEFLLNNIVDVHQLESFHFYSRDSVALVQLEKKEAEPLMQLFDILKSKRNDINSPVQVAIIRSLIFAFLYEASSVYNNDQKVTQPKLTRDEDLNFKFNQLMTQHDKVQHNLKFYADSLYITPKYLIHVVKNVSGKTPGELIQEALIAHAKLLLKNLNNSVSSVADELHFSDQASFSKFFKKHTGMSPLSYRTKG